ncbi:MAG: hypothetical protein U9R01_06070 [candidate division WOR-3 bacterium]|nr:hypothetical protein [candidate division WOR-3 bacterium]
MKIFLRYKKICWLLLGTTFNSWLILGMCYGENILSNSSFEIWHDTLGLSAPNGWVTSELYNSSTAVRTTHAHTGTYAIQLGVPSQDGAVGGVGRFVNIVGGSNYTLNLYYDCPEGVKGYVAIAQFDESDSVLHIVSSYLGPSAGYSLFDTTFTAHENAAKFWVGCNISAEGDGMWGIYYDDIGLYRIP